MSIVAWNYGAANPYSYVGGGQPIQTWSAVPGAFTTVASFTTQAIPLLYHPGIAGPKSIQHRIMDLVIKRLERISHANGFYTPVTEVRHNQQYEQIQEPAAGPIIYVYDAEDQLDKALSGVEELALLVTVEGWTYATAPEQIANLNHWFLSDIKEAIWFDHNTLQLDPHFRGLAESMQFIRGRLVYGPEDELSAATITEWSITFMEVRGAPHKNRTSQ